MAMSDADFEAALNQLGLSADNNYSSSDGSETSAVPASFQPSASPQEPNATMSAAGTPPPEAQQAFQGMADIRKADDTNPSSQPAPTPQAGFDGSPDANPNVPVPSMPGDASGQSAPSGSTNPSSMSQQQSLSVPATSLLSSTNNPLSNNPDLNDEALKKAQDTANLKRLITGIGEAGGTAATEGVGKTFDPSFYREQNKMADSGVQDIETRRNAMLANTKVVDSILTNQLKGLSLSQQQQANDPNSSISQTARGIIKMLHPGIETTPGFNQLGAEDLKDFTQHILESQAKLDAAKSARDTANSFKQQTADARTQGQQAREDQQNQQMQDKISKEVNTLSQSSRNALGTAGRSLISADRASAILNQPTVTPQDLSSVSADISNIISGSATVSGTQHQQYNTLKAQSDNLIQQLTANPQDIDAPQLKQHLQDVIAGMRKISSDTAQKNLNFVKVSHPAFAAKNPAYFEDIAKGLSDQTAPPDQTSQTGTAASTPASQSGNYTQDVMDYAKSHNITPDQANQIKLQRTSGGQ